MLTIRPLSNHLAVRLPEAARWVLRCPPASGGSWEPETGNICVCEKPLPRHKKNSWHTPLQRYCFPLELVIKFPILFSCTWGSSSPHSTQKVCLGAATSV